MEVVDDDRRLAKVDVAGVRRNAGQRHSYVRHQLRVFFAIQEKRAECIDREQPTPEKQRAFLSGPQRGEFIKQRQRAIAVRRHVRQREIVGEKEVFERGDGKRNEAADRHSGIARAFREQRASCEDTGYARYKGVCGGK